MNPKARLRPLAEQLALGVASWFLGMAAYVLLIFIVYREAPTDETLGVGIWTAMILMVTFPFVYLPAMFVLRFAGLAGPWWLRATQGAVFAIAPIAVFKKAFGSSSPFTLTQDAALLAVVFVVAGAIFCTACVDD